jgi:hypothetical protein
MVSSCLIVVLSLVSLANCYDKEALAGWFMGLKPEKVTYAVNCGSIEATTDLLGVKYEADQNFVGGVTSDDGTTK